MLDLVWFYIKLRSLLYHFIYSSDFYSFLVLLSQRLPAEIAIVSRQVDKFIMRLIYFLWMLYHQISLLEVSKHLLNRLRLWTFITFHSDRRTGRTTLYLIFYLSNCFANQITYFLDSICIVRLSFCGRLCPTWLAKHEVFWNFCTNTKILLFSCQ